MPEHFADRLMAAVLAKGAAACVGLDPLIEHLPADLRRKHALSSSSDAVACANALYDFGREIIDIVAPLVPVVKINIAFFERYYAEGLRAYYRLVKHARQAGLITIGDVKRADIGHSTTQYAHAQLAEVALAGCGEFAAPDAVTVSPYLGFDAVAPFAEVAKREGKGLFVLVQTSNESAEAIQGLTLEGGETVCQRVGRIVQSWAAAGGMIGACGYSAIGAVVSPRDVPSTVRLRELMPNCLFLVPGFGAQGRTTDEVARCFKSDGTGALITSSRGVIFAYQDAKVSAACGGDWRKCVERGCRELVAAVRGITVPSDQRPQ